MISVLLYGRNDSHGYNLHKRAALSLNCMAEVLGRQDDEILFVDYNTPDELPTFPEAIADTLSEAARSRLRILRVRPSHHRAFAPRTHLQVLEPIARNVGLRRSNPQNRWVLSTNTDMVFVPQGKARTLGEITQGLECALFHLPRFELPQSLWESLDRTQPVEAMAQIADWGAALHLDEVVTAAYGLLFDAPGDFQLAPRDDLFAINGFHEEMLRGWHVDSNLARRLRLRLGPVQPLADRLKGYHCDHTKQATTLHRRSPVQNDWNRFVEAVDRADIPEQAEAWGLAGEAIEEIRLDRRGPRIAGAIAGLVQRQVEPSQGMPDWATFGDLRYDPRHALPYVLDLLEAGAADTRIRYAGASKEMLALFSSAMARLQPDVQVSVCQDVPWLGAPDTGLPFDLWSQTGDVFVLEVGAPLDADQDELREHQARAQVVDRLLWRLATSDAPPPGARVIAINSVNNPFGWTVASVLNAPHAPFGTRVRHGRLAFSLAPIEAPSARELSSQLAFGGGRLAYPSEAEVNRLMDLLKAALDHDFDPSLPESWTARRFAEPLIRLTQTAGIDRSIGATAPELSNVRDRLEELRPSRRLLPLASTLGAATGPSAAPSRLANFEDWERPSFLRPSERFFSGLEAYNSFERTLLRWECGAIVELAESLIASRAGEGAAQVLLISGDHHGDAIAYAIRASGAEVDIVSGPPGEWTSAAPDAAYDAVILCRDALLKGGLLVAGSTLSAAFERLKVTGLLAYTAPVRLDAGRDDRSIPRLALDATWRAEAGERTGLGVWGVQDFRVRAATIDHASAVRRDGDTFVEDGPDGVRTLALWSWRRTGAALSNAAPDMTSLLALEHEELGEAASLDRLVELGTSEEFDLMPLARVNAGVHASDGQILIPADATRAFAVFGPYIHLPAGSYQVELQAEPGSAEDLKGGGRTPFLSVDVTQGNSDGLALRSWTAAQLLAERQLIDFHVPLERLDQPIEVRLSHFGEANILVRAMTLRRLSRPLQPAEAEHRSTLGRVASFWRRIAP